MLYGQSFCRTFFYILNFQTVPTFRFLCYQFWDTIISPSPLPHLLFMHESYHYAKEYENIDKPKHLGFCEKWKHYLFRLRSLVFIEVLTHYMSRVSSGSIVSDYGLDDRAIGIRCPAEAKDFSSSLCVQTGSGAHPASCPMGTEGLFPGGKSAAGAWRWPLTPI
jgi:hypothetical protein